MVECLYSSLPNAHVSLRACHVHMWRSEDNTYELSLPPVCDSGEIQIVRLPWHAPLTAEPSGQSCALNVKFHLFLTEMG